jgi:S1-C subfamily serine protease
LKHQFTITSIIVLAGIIITAFLLYPDYNKLNNENSVHSTTDDGNGTLENLSPMAETEKDLSRQNTSVQGQAQAAKDIEQQASFTPVQLFEKTQSSVVQITDSSESNPADSRLGSGFVYDGLGHIITNYHVVLGSDRIDVTFPDGTMYGAKLIGADPYTDLAVLQVSDAPKDKLVPVVMANSTQSVVGQQVAAIGNPFGLSGSMTTGIVSGLRQLIPAQVQSSDSSSNPFSIPDIIQTDASINPGNSGGPLLNMNGEVIGINSAIFSTTGAFAGVGFAIPSNTITKIVRSLISTGSFKHPWLGISGTNMNPDIAEALGLEVPRGFLVVDVVAGSPAEKAGIKGGEKPTTIDGREILLGGDVITKFDGRDVRKIDDILVYLQRE